MNGPQIDAIRRDLCLSTERMAQLLHVPPLTLARWVARPPEQDLDDEIGQLSASLLTHIGRNVLRKRAIGDVVLRVWANDIYEALAVNPSGLHAVAFILSDLLPTNLPEGKRP